ncbi:hypothetical protein M378DRAFT_1040533, partial [Amanita muscaria Koide BX008]
SDGSCATCQSTKAYRVDKKGFFCFGAWYRPRGLRQFIGIHGEEDYISSTTADRSAVFGSLIEGVMPRVVQKQPGSATKKKLCKSVLRCGLFVALTRWSTKLIPWLLKLDMPGISVRERRKRRRQH